MSSIGYKKMTNYPQHVEKAVLALTQGYLRSSLRFDRVEYGSEEAQIFTISYLKAAFHCKDLENLLVDGRKLLSRVVRASLPVLVFDLPLPRVVIVS